MYRYSIRIFLVLMICLINFMVFGQLRPEILPEDFIADETHITCYCKPGVRNQAPSKGIQISYGILGSGTYKEQTTQLSSSLTSYSKVRHLEFDIKVPVILKDNFKLLFGYKYFSEFFDIQTLGADFTETFQGLGDNNLKSNSLSLILSKPLNETKYLAFRFRYSSNGNYDQWLAFDEKYSIYKFLGFYGIKKNEDLEWGFGLNFSKSFRNTNFIPFIVLNKNLNDQWGLEAVFPASIFIRCNFNPYAIALAGIEYDSQSYRIDIDAAADEVISYAYNHSEFIASTKLEFRVAPWIWGKLKLGYQFNLSSDFESKNTITSTFNVDPSDSLFFDIGIFLSPPASF